MLLTLIRSIFIFALITAAGCMAPGAAEPSESDKAASDAAQGLQFNLLNALLAYHQEMWRPYLAAPTLDETIRDTVARIWRDLDREVEARSPCFYREGYTALMAPDADPAASTLSEPCAGAGLDGRRTCGEHLAVLDYLFCMGAAAESDADLCTDLYTRHLGYFQHLALIASKQRLLGLVLATDAASAEFTAGPLLEVVSGQVCATPCGDDPCP